MSPCLPEFIRNYFAADAAGDAAILASCFLPDGTVGDEGQAIKGRAAIADWISEAKRKYGHRSEPLSTFEADGRIHVIARVTGDFPGSPAELDHRFTLTPLGIANLEIG